MADLKEKGKKGFGNILRKNEAIPGQGRQNLG